MSYFWAPPQDPVGGAYSAPPDYLACGEGLAVASPKNPNPASAFGLDFWHFGLQTSAPCCPPKYHYSPNTGAVEYTLIYYGYTQLKIWCLVIKFLIQINSTYYYLVLFISQLHTE